MTSNQFAIRLFNTSEPILIDTHFTQTGEPRIQSLTKVGHLIQGIQPSLLYQSTLLLANLLL
jgi:hypothetical protein